MLRTKSPQASFYGSYLYDRIIPPDHLLRKINAVVDFSFIRDLVKDRYTPNFGRPAEDPEFMLRLCLLQYLYGDSDRHVIENARVNLAYKFFLGLAVDDDVPDDTTMSYFRAHRLGEEKFKAVFQNIVQQCIDKGLVTGKRQIIDSTHIVADIAVTSLTGLLTLCRKKVLKQVARQNQGLADILGLKKLKHLDQVKYTDLEKGLKDETEAATKLLDAITEELKQGRLKPDEHLVDDLELLEKAVSDRREEAKDRLVSPVDPDARMGRKTSKHWAGYKGHITMDEESEIITGVETTPGNKDDGSQLKPLLEQQEKAHSLVPSEVSGDKAYDSGANLELLDGKGITGNVRMSKISNHCGEDLFTTDDFHFDPDNETLTCPAGQMARSCLREAVHNAKAPRKGLVFEFGLKQCGKCPLKARCIKGKNGRAVHISYYRPWVKQMEQRLATEAGQEAMRRRSLIEHRIADLARYCGLRHSRYRGLARTKTHTLLSAIASNEKRMAKLLWKSPEPPLLAVTVVA